MTMQALTTATLQGDTRAYRSMLAQRLARTLGKLLLQHAVEHLELGKARVGRITHRIHWHSNHAYRFVLDFDAGAVTIPSLAAGTPPQQLLRELKIRLRPGTVGRRPALAPQKGELRVFVKHGALTLSITVMNDAYEYCTEYLVSLASDVLRAGLEPIPQLDHRDAS